MIIKEEINITPFHEKRMLHIYYPDHLKRGKRPGVIYMFDGHNLFNDEDATYGKCWGLRDYFDHHLPNVMVVGLECNHEGNQRLCEFSPYSFEDHYFGKINARGKQLLDWMTTDLKTYIEKKYKVDKRKEKTVIAGSSMGGLMAVYAGSIYPHIYSKAACLSPFYENIFPELIKDIKHQKQLEHSTFYLSWGCYEWRSKRALAKGTERNLKISRLLTEKGAKVFPHCMENGHHNEESWEKEIPLFMKELKIDQF